MKRYLPLVLLLTACGKGPDFSGTYTGLETGSQNGTNFSQQVTLILSQTDKAITGSFAAGAGNTGSVTGTTDGSGAATFTITQTSGNCTGSLKGTGTLSDKTLSASIGGTMSCGNVTANLSLTKP